MRRKIRGPWRRAPAGARLEAGEKNQSAVLDSTEIDRLATGKAEVADDGERERSRVALVEERRPSK